MMPFAELFSFGSEIIKRIFPDKESQQKYQQRLLELEQQGELKELETRMSVIIAEANSKDSWTSRARPSFMYVFYFLIVSLVVVAPVIGVFYPAEMNQFYANVKAGFDAIPGALWGTFTAGYLGYGGYRTFEKYKGVAK